MSDTRRVLATTGHREPRRWPQGAIADWIALLADERLTEIRLGGAAGWDTEALRQAAAHRGSIIGAARSRAKTYDKPPPEPIWSGYRLVVYCTARVTDLPSEAHRAVNDCLDDTLGDRLVELRLVEPGATSQAWGEAFRRRNKAMLVGGHRDGAGKLAIGTRATRLFACWDGRPSGTGHTVGVAEELGIPVVFAGGDPRPVDASGRRAA